MFFIFTETCSTGVPMITVQGNKRHQTFIDGDVFEFYYGYISF